MSATPPAPEPPFSVEDSRAQIRDMFEAIDGKLFTETKPTTHSTANNEHQHRIPFRLP